jgi:hypothetical protein
MHTDGCSLHSLQLRPLSSTQGAHWGWGICVTLSPVPTHFSPKYAPYTGQVGAPLGEVIIVNVLHLWHYARPDFFGVPHWAGWCYATYALGVANAARLLQARQEKY